MLVRAGLSEGQALLLLELVGMGEGPTQICEVCQPNKRPKACYRSGSTAGGTPQRSWVRSPSGANFSSGLKKTPSLVPRPKHCGARPNSQGDGPPCTGGAGVRGFSWPAVRRSFYLSKNAVGAVLPPAGQVFLLLNKQSLCKIIVILRIGIKLHAL